MAGKRRSTGGIYTERGKLGIRFYWVDPAGGPDLYRWRIGTQKEATESNRQELKALLDSINVKIDAGVFYPCKEFPETKIAAYCRCPACLVAVPMTRSHAAPLTLGELKEHYLAAEKMRATGDQKEIELSSYTNKEKAWSALSKSFEYKLDGVAYEFDALTDYTISELTPEDVQDWLRAFQNRGGISTPNRTKYLINLLSEIKLALKFGQFKRWWGNHALLDFQGTLLRSTKTERSDKDNASIHKPFTLHQRNAIIEWYKDYWHSCSAMLYGGKEKLRRFFLYHYVVIGFNTGMRSPSEMTALAWPVIDYQRRDIHVCKSRESSGSIANQVIREYTKTIKHRHVPINDMTLESLRALENYRQDESDWVFWNPRASSKNPFLISNGWAPLTGEKRIRYSFEQCLTALKIESGENQGQYRMRHTFVTLTLDNTSFSDAKVAALIGDNVETMRRHYAGFCQNRWRDDSDLDQLNMINQQKHKKRLKVVK